MTRALFVELRRSPLRWILPVLIALDLAMLFGRSRDWIGVWPQASAAAQLPVWFFAPALAAGAAWSAGREGRTGDTAYLAATARPAWQRELAHLLATLTYGWVALAVGALVAAAVSIREAGPGFLWPGYLLLAASLVTLCGAAGHAAGRVSRSRLTPPLASAGVVFALLWFEPLPAVQFYVLSGPPQLAFDPVALGVRVALAVTASAAAVAIAGKRDAGNVAGWAPVLGTCMALAVAAASVVVAGPLRVARQPPDPPLCAAGVPTVCVWPEHRKELDALAAAAGRLGGLDEAGLVIVPAAFYEEGLRPEPGFALVLGRWVAVRGMVASAMNATFPQKPCRSSDVQAQDRRATAQIELLEWLVARAFGGPRPSGYHGGFAYDTAQLDRVLAAPDGEQFAWARERITVITEPRCGS